ncbi:hypothetical protein LSH36_191g00009 [Paralvinella palmiformis]|uniref:Transmembrane protein 33 n=1 Tax=Paralvinella palmiformis TaxID=53620 RepID=A0AAD9JQP5_9ANNE|nr:hypothetical protein LSH36_191g00009 [Paralvinella palmiformis]
MDGNSGDQSTPEANAGARPTQEGTVQRIIGHMSGNKIEAALWITRIMTMFFVLNFFLPVFSASQSSYQKAVLSNAATSALRLHQRLPNFQMNREFFGRLLLEDSAHYLFYSLIFVSSYPVTMVLVPIFLFAVLHAQKYTQQILNVVGPNSLGVVRRMLAKLDSNQVGILRFIACTEIFLMPAILFMMFTGHASIFLPFIYYRFLTLRYSSRRNPYCRQLFSELRVAMENICSSPSCPAFVRNIVYKVIAFISRLAPQIPTA